MAFEFQGKTIRKIGVIGSGQIGPDIALYFTKVFHKFGVPVVVVDVVQEALDRGRGKLEKKVAKGKESGAFAEDMAASMLEHVKFTMDYGQLADADLIVEAATEDLGLKGKIFGQLEKQCPPSTIFASNSSHLEPEAIFSSIENKARTAVVHYFFPAERNIMVEVVPGKDTDPNLADWLLAFYEEIGKCPIRVGSRYGYAIDPIFEGIFLAAARLVEQGLGTTKEVDAVAAKALGLAVGPFTAMNLTGGNPITYNGCKHYETKVSKWFAPPKSLEEKVKSKEAWDVPGRGEVIEVDTDRKKLITDRMQGAYFGLVCEVLDSKIVSLGDFELGLENALAISPPFSMMNDLGIKLSFDLLKAYAAENPEFPVSKTLEERAAKNEPWKISVLQTWRDGEVGVIKLRRPRVLNALNEEAYKQIQEAFAEQRKDPAVKAVVFTGFGVKAFISGADVNFLARIETAEQGEATSAGSHTVMNFIENLGKPVVCAMNGLAFGGGMELAMACTARICRKDLKPLGAQPEPNLGIIPGAGATQRLPRLVGLERAAELLRTGRPFSSAEAVEWGLVREEVEGDLIGRAIELARQAARGEVTLEPINREPLQVPTALPEVNLRHLSKSVDGILCRAILEGCAKPLDQGLKFESKMFGAVCATRDMRIGVDNFIKNGPKSKAEFVHA